MLNETKYYCPECDEGFDLPEVRSRRDFLRAIGATAALATVATPRLRAADAPARPAEELIKELYATMSADQKDELVLPYDHGTEGHPTRQKTYNAPPLGAEKREVLNFETAKKPRPAENPAGDFCALPAAAVESHLDRHNCIPQIMHCAR